MDNDKIWKIESLRSLRDAWYGAFAQKRAHRRAGRIQPTEHSFSNPDWPTLNELQASGADIHHPGQALVGANIVTSRGQDKLAFHFIDAGASHARYAGRVIKGVKLSELAHPAHAERSASVYFNVLESAAPHAWRCMNMARNAPPKVYSRVIVPISDDIGDGRCLFGIWVWDAEEQGVSSADESLRTLQQASVYPRTASDF